ncbi:MAG: polysaccharide deacetylase family protein [Bacteroidetes bacterium]|nr:polysaccharide deacetylase family protein [Bacteroidota bacterium]
MVLIYNYTITERFKYIADLIFSRMLGVQFNITASADEFESYPGPKIVYGKEPLPGGIFIKADGLLEQTHIPAIKHDVGSFNQYPVIFSSPHNGSCLPFDPFAASFFMATRYEEYLHFEKDRYGRYPAKESIASKARFLDIPAVHHWVEMILDELAGKFPEMKFHKPAYRFIPTIDIDHAWCYLGRPLIRTLGGLGRSLAHGHFRDISDRLQTLAGIKADPFDNFNFIDNVHQNHAEQPFYFVLNADYGGDDNNVDISSKHFHELIKKLDRFQRVGIHPSLKSGKNEKALHTEISGLANVLQRKIGVSRQHFLKLSFPDTYRTLIKFGVEQDYSMGYASHPGFRAGMALPFPFFDLLENKTTSLMIHPVMLMDVTLKDYMRLNPVESLEFIAGLIEKVRTVNGELVTIWHNESLGNHSRWYGWRDVYEEMVKLAST